MFSAGWWKSCQKVSAVVRSWSRHPSTPKRIRNRNRPAVTAVVEHLEDRSLLSPFYDLQTVASTASGEFVKFGDLASINNSGTVAFVGYRNDADGNGENVPDDVLESGLWVARPTGGITNVNPDFTESNGRDFGRAVAINDDGLLSARDIWNGEVRVRKWDSTKVDHETNVASNAGGFKNAGLQTFTDINARGDVAFVSQSLGGEFRNLELLPHDKDLGESIKLATFPAGAIGGPTPRPQLTKDGRVLARMSNGTISLIKADGTQQVFASDKDGFIETGAAPGITDDGYVVVFTGNHGRGDGVFMSYYYGNERRIERIAGEGLDGWTEFDLNSAIRVSGAITSDERGVTVAFEGTNSVLGHGIYTSRASFFGLASTNYHISAIHEVRVSGASPVALVGEPLTSGGSRITELELYGMNEISRGELAFWAKTGSQEAIVRAIPQQVLHVDLTPGLYPLGGYTDANLALLGEVGLQNGWEGTFAQAMTSLGYTGNPFALGVQVYQSVQELFDATGARIRVVSTAPEYVPRTATKQNGEIILSVNGYPVRNGAYQTVQVGQAASNEGLLGLAAPVFTRAGGLDFYNQIVDDAAVVFANRIFSRAGGAFTLPFSQLTDAVRIQALAVTIAHEAGHNFGLVHTRRDALRYEPG
jgi:hypothetical protein